MQLITSDKQRELSRALKGEDPIELIQYADTIKRLAKNKHLFTQRDGQQETAYVVMKPESAGRTTYTVPLMQYCHERKFTSGKEMTKDEFSKFISDDGQITK